MKSAVTLAAMVSGGSTVSTSWIWLPVIVRVQSVAAGRSPVGSRVQTAVPDPLSEKAVVVPVGHSRPKASASAVTGSLKVTVIVAPADTLVAPSAGDVETTVGAVSTVVKPAV